MTEQQTTAVFMVVYVLGVLTRILWPFLLAYVRENVKFDWRYIGGQALVSLAGFLTLFLVADDVVFFVGELQALGYIGAFVYGFGASSIGRNVQKTGGTIQYVRNGRK